MEQKNHAEFFKTNGYLIIQNAIDSTLADQIKDSMILIHHAGYQVGMLKRHLVVANQATLQDPKFRYKDLYVNNPLVRRAVFSSPILSVLSQLENSPLLAFQNMGFMRGSGLRIHRDSNYVDIQGLNAQFYGCWIALEDVNEGAGELIYYPGSHLLPPYHFHEDSTHWVVSRDGIYANDACHTWLEKQMSDYGLAPQKFLAREGDCIIWHGDLVHTGAPIQNPAHTRHSLITHFCSVASRPRYLRGAALSQILPFNDQCYFSSAHYDLTTIDNIARLDREQIKPKLLATAES